MISAFSEGEGKGCTFTVILPLYSLLRMSEKSLRNSTASYRPSNSSMSIKGIYAMFPSTPVFRNSSISADLNVMVENSTKVTPSVRVAAPIQIDVSSHREGIDYRKEEDDEAEDLDCKIDAVMSISPRANDEKPFSMGYKILVADDSDLNRKMLCRLLRFSFEDVRITEAVDGLEAVHFVRRSSGTGAKPFDVILMDYQMPQLDGPNAVKEIRCLGYGGLIIGITGNALPADINLFLSRGADRVLQKPIDLEDLSEAIASKNTILSVNTYYNSKYNYSIAV